MGRDECPSTDAIQSILAGATITDEDGEMLEHFASCDRCRDVLEAKVDNVEVGHWRTLLTKSAGCIPSDTTLLDPESFNVAAPPKFPNIEGFQLLEEIGRGGSGVVYRARQIALDRFVALKVLSTRAKAPDRAIARMRQESRLIAQFRHPNVVAIHGMGWHDDAPYLCLELIEGGSLADRLSGNPAPPLVAARLLSTLARTIQDLHDQGIIHRDLKPANILLEGDRNIPLDRCIPKLTDFGLSKRLISESPILQTNSGEVLGTPSYMAPEQLSVEKGVVGKPVDIYGLGAVLFELLTGRPPYLGDSPLETALQIVSKPVPRPRKFDPSISSSLESICLNCLRKNPGLRYASAKALADDLDRYLENPSKTSSGRLVLGTDSRTFRTRLGIGAVATILFGAGILLIPLLGRKVENPAEAKSALTSVNVLSPPPRVVPVGQEYLAEARVEAVGADLSTTGKSANYIFDLQEGNSLVEGRFRDRELMRNAKFWEEPRHEIRYWGPVNAREPFQVAYQFPFDFEIRSARLSARVDFYEDSQYRLEVTTNPSRGWVTLATSKDSIPGVTRKTRGGSEHDIGDIVRGSRKVYLRATLKGREDGRQSCLAQFLRTSTSAHEHRELKGSEVFQIKASERQIPNVVCEVATSNDDVWSPLRVSDDGTVRLTLKWQETGPKTFRIRGSVDGGAWTERQAQVLVVDPGTLVSVDPFSVEIGPGESYRAMGQIQPKLVGGRPWSGSADYGDGTGENPLPVGADGTFPLEHRYLAPGRYNILMKLRNDDGRFAGNIGVCLVRPIGKKP